MTNKVIIQFAPRPRGRIELNIEEDNRRVREISESEEGLITLYLKNGNKFELLPNGTIRYSIEQEECVNDSLIKQYEFARQFIGEHNDGYHEYNVLILLSQNNNRKISSDFSEELQELVNTEFKGRYPNYSQMGKDSVKLSFQDKNSDRILI